MLKVRTLFSGIGAPESALKNIGIDYELVDFCEVDKYAVKSYCAVHGVSEDKNLGDITKVWGRSLPYADLLVWGFPCTDISVAGKQAGIIEGGTRSGLYYEGLRILRETKPKYSIIENVKNLTGKQFKAEFEQMLIDIKEIGYNNYWKVLNAKNYGIPQNRERVFIVSIRADIDTGKFEFPIGFDNGLRLKDFLENEVDEKYYINRPWHISTESDEKHDTNEIAQLEGINYKATRSITDINKICRCLDTMGGGQREPKILTVGQASNKGSQAGKVYSPDGIFPTVCACTHGYAIGNIVGIPCIAASRGRNPINPSDRTTGSYTEQRLEVNTTGNSNTLTTVQRDNYVLESNYRIRKLTPKECWRLMGFTDEEFDKAKWYTDEECKKIKLLYTKSKRKNAKVYTQEERIERISDSQLYKQAGNSIVTKVLADIFKNLLQADIKANIEEEKILS